MKRRHFVCLLLALLLMAGCGGEIQKASQAPQTTETPTAAIDREVRPGIYMSNDLTDFPFPASGYDVYLVGETHGNREAKDVFQTYLKILYQEAGLRDVVLEEDQGYESDTVAYVLGSADALPPGLCLRTDILGQLREFNAALPAAEKVNVHLVDVDSPLSIVHKHLAELHAQLGETGASIHIPAFSEFETWSPKQTIDLIKKLESAAAGQTDILNGLETVRQSFRWYTMGNDMDKGTGLRSKFGPLREDIITQNMQHLVTRLNGKPVLAYYGYHHAEKMMIDPDPPVEGFKTWAQRLSESGINVYSLYVGSKGGNGYWRGEAFQYPASISQFQFKDGSSLHSFFEKYPGTEILYTDLRVEENKDIRLPPGYLDIAAGQVHDGLVIFNQFTPMEDACSGAN